MDDVKEIVEFLATNKAASPSDLLSLLSLGKKQSLKRSRSSRAFANLANELRKTSSRRKRKRKNSKVKRLGCKHKDSVSKGGSVEKRLSKIEELTDNLMGTLVYKWRQIDQCNAALGNSNHCDSAIMSRSIAETVLAQLRYYDPSAPTALVNADFSSGTYGREVRFRGYQSFIRIRANGHVPAIVHLYLCVAKEDTSITPVSSYTNGLTDIGNPSSLSPLSYLSDSPQFTALYEVKKAKKMTLNPGDELKWSFSGPCYIYDASYVDNHTQDYFRGVGAHWVYRVEGAVSHGATTSSQIGTAPANIDVVIDTVFTVDYNAGADILYHYHEDATSVTDHVVSSRQTENLSYGLGATS